MKWLLNTLAALADATDCEPAAPYKTTPMALRPVTGILGAKQIAWCDQNLHGFKVAREQAEAAWAEPRLAITDPGGQLMGNYVDLVKTNEDFNQIMEVMRQNVAGLT